MIAGDLLPVPGSQDKARALPQAPSEIALTGLQSVSDMLR